MFDAHRLSILAEQLTWAGTSRTSIAMRHSSIKPLCLTATLLLVSLPASAQDSTAPQWTTSHSQDKLRQLEKSTAQAEKAKP